MANKRKKLKIFMIAPTSFFADRGCHTRILEEAKALQRLGHEVVIYTYHNGRDIKGIRTKRIINIPWYNKLNAGPSWHKIYLDILLFFKSYFGVLKEKPNLMYVHLQEGALIGGWINKFLTKKIPLIADLQDILIHELKEYNFIKEKTLRYLFFNWLEKSILRLPNFILTSSLSCKKMIIKEYNFSKQKIDTLMQGVDTNLFRPSYNVSKFRKKLNLPQKNVVLYMGLLNYNQGVDVLFKAIPKVLKKITDAHFFIIGYPNIEKYMKIAKEKKFYKNITFQDKTPYHEIGKYVALANIGVSAKIGDSESNDKVLAYMATGLPCAVSDVGINKELLQDLGFFSRITDPDSLADAIIKALKCKDKGLGKKSRERVKKLYSWDSRGKQIINTYEKLISK